MNGVLNIEENPWAEGPAIEPQPTAAPLGLGPLMYDMKRGGGVTCIPCLDKHMICIDPMSTTLYHLHLAVHYASSWLIKPT